MVKKSAATYKWYDLGIELLELKDLHALDEIQINYPRDVGDVLYKDVTVMVGETA